MMERSIKRIISPTIFTEANVNFFLRDIEPIFKLQGKFVEGISFDMRPTTKIDLLGLVLLYKYLEYTLAHDCYKNPQIQLNDNKYLLTEIEKFGFYKLIKSLINRVEKPDYSLNYSLKDGFFIAPIVLKRKSDEDVGKECKKIQQYYQEHFIDPFGAFQTLAEIASNFRAHATSDSQSILAARGNEDYIEIVCADTGNGIISTLRSTLRNCSKNDILKKSLDRGVTSKENTCHMGHGLWIINEFIKIGNGYLKIYTEGLYLKNKNKKISVGQAPYWKGTIIYVKLPMKDSTLYSKVLSSNSTNSKIKINRI